MSVFVREYNEEIFERRKELVLTENFFIHFHYWDQKLKVEPFIDRSACRAKFAVQNALFDFLFNFQ